MRKRLKFCFIVLLTGSTMFAGNRIIILADMGCEPDEMQQMVHMLMCSNLQKHATGWHSPEYLHSIVCEGQAGYGINDIGEGKSSEGSELLLRAFEKDDPRPIWIAVNAGSNTLAQALLGYEKTHSEFELKLLVKKLCVFENGSQDNAGAYICQRYPSIHWIRSNYQTYAYGGFTRKPGPMLVEYTSNRHPMPLPV